MNNYHLTHHLEPADTHEAKADILRPFHWIQSGWHDFSYHPAASFGYGIIVTVLLSMTYLFAGVNIYSVAAAMTGFMLVGPILAAGLCELSWRHETNEPLSFDQSMTRLYLCRSTLYQFAGILLGFSVLWFALSALILTLTLGYIAPPIDQVLWGNFFEHTGGLHVLLYLLMGGILAIVVFSVSVVSIPAIIEMGVSVQEAMLLSFKVFMTNLPTMIVWGGILVALCLIGTFTFFLAMIVLFPLLGHATWYAYRDLVEDEVEISV